MTATNAAALEVHDFKKGQVPREVRIRQLLDLAEELFLEHGYEGFSIEDLCRAAEVSRPVVYEHFGSKPGIYLACQKRIRDDFDEVLRSALTESGDVIREVSTVYFSVLQENPQRWMFAFGSSAGYVGPMAEELFEMRRSTVANLADIVHLLRSDLSDEQAMAVATMVSGASEALGRWWMYNLDIPLERIVDYNIDAMGAIARGITAR